MNNVHVCVYHVCYATDCVYNLVASYLLCNCGVVILVCAEVPMIGTPTHVFVDMHQLISICLHNSKTPSRHMAIYTMICLPLYYAHY